MGVARLGPGSLASAQRRPHRLRLFHAAGTVGFGHLLRPLLRRALARPASPPVSPPPSHSPPRHVQRGTSAPRRQPVPHPRPDRHRSQQNPEPVPHRGLQQLRPARRRRAVTDVPDRVSSASSASYLARSRGFTSTATTSPSRFIWHSASSFSRGSCCMSGCNRRAASLYASRISPMVASGRIPSSS